MTGRRWLTIRDFVTLRPSEVLDNKKYFFETKDAKSESGHSLLVHVAATHAGIVNGNRKFYRPDKMQDSVGTWLPKNSYPRPVLVGHNEDGDVLGRVREAKYVDESWKYASEFPALKDSLFYSTDAKRRTGLFRAVDWIVDNLQNLDGYTGLGHIDLGMQITNPEAIRKVLADEFLTVSTGAATDEAICSICHQDWTSDDKCEHKPGGVYDNKRMFLICGNFRYKEVSFVNHPADPFAFVTGKELKDNLEKLFFLGLPVGTQDERVESGLILTDSLYEGDIHLSQEDMMQTLDVAAIRAALATAELTAEQAFALKDQVSAWAPEAEDDKVTKRSLTTSISVAIRKHGFTRDAAPTVAAEPGTMTDEQIQAALAENEDAKANPFAKKKKGACEECKKDPCECEKESDDKQGNNAAAAIGKPALKEGTGKGAVPEASTPESRPNGDPQERKGGKKKKKCAACTKDFETEDEAAEVCEDCTLTDSVKHVIELMAQDEQAKEHATNGSEVVTLIKSLDASYAKVRDEVRWSVRYAVRCLIDHWSADDELKSMLAILAKGQDAQVVSNTDMQIKDELIAELTEAKDAFDSRKKALEQTAAACVLDSKKSLASQIVMAKVLKGADGYKGLTAEQIQDKVGELSKRSLVSLKDTVHDLLSELEWATPEPAATSNPQAAEPAVQVSDNAQVDESEAANVPAGELTVLDAQRTVRALSYISSPAERERVAAEIRWNQRKPR